MPKMHLRPPGFTYGTCGSFIKKKETIQKFRKHEIHNIFIKTN